MSANEVLEQIDKLPAEEQEKIFTQLAEKILSRREGDSKRWLGKKMSFEEACEVVFRENHELLGLLAK
jgi:hypothetical protein